MSNKEETIIAPVVFISYSHDNPQHMRWVTSLAEKLITEGNIDVIIDCWNTSPGEDIGIFMEQGVTQAQKVLMICSETYSQKVDDGVGGAGYEGGIVRAELISKIGTTKFIPIISPGNTYHRVPKCLESKKYLDMSKVDNYAQKFNELVISIRNYSSLVKPQLGLSEQFKAIENLKNTLQQNQSSLKLEDEIPIDAIECFNHARAILVSGNMFNWKEYLKLQRKYFFQELIQYRNKNERKINTNNTGSLIEMVVEAASTSQRLFATIAAGIISEQESYRHHAAVIADILRPSDWNRSGQIIFTALPSAITFIYHYLIGAVSVNSQQFDLAFENANFKIVDDYNTSSLILSHEANGFEDSYGRSFTSGVKVLHSLFNKWRILSYLFDNEENYIASISTYNILLILSCFIHNPNKIFTGKDAIWNWHIPPIFLFTKDYNIRRITKQKLTTNFNQLLSKIINNHISTDTIISCWQNYITAWENSDGMFYYFIEDSCDDFKKFFSELFYN